MKIELPNNLQKIANFYCFRRKNGRMRLEKKAHKNIYALFSQHFFQEIESVAVDK